MSEVTAEPLEEITDAIVAAVQPERIILFGSRARGEVRADSDLDLLIIEREPFAPDRSRRKEFVKVSRALKAYTVPIDILLYSRDEFDRWQHSTSHVIGRAVRDGKILYERP